MATIGQNAKELKKLYEQSMEKGANDGDQFIAPSRAAFQTNLEQLIGIETKYTARGKKYKKFNKEKVKIPVEELDISAFGMEANGHGWATNFEQNWDRAVQTSRFESIGTPQMAGSLPITCAINDAYGIFLDGRVYAEEADEGYIGGEFCTVEEPVVTSNGAIVNGGFRAGRRTGVKSNDATGTDVGEGIIPPNMGQELETLLHINRARLNARQFSWTYDSVRFNRIADDVAKALNAARVVKYEEERKVADIVLGVGASLATSSAGNIGQPGLATPVEVGGLEFYPYQNGVWVTGGTAVSNSTNAGSAAASPLNGAYEQNYANALDTNGLGLTQVSLAQMLGQRIANRDPFTGDVIPASLKGDTIWVANDEAEIQLLTLLYQWFIGIGATTLSSANGVSLYNFAKEQGLNIKKSQRWANRLTDVGILTDHTTIGTFVNQKLTFTPATDTCATPGSILSAVVIGRPKECIGKNLLQPFMVEDFNVPGTEQMRGIAGIRKVSERSMTYFKEVPRRLSRMYA